MDNLHFDQKAFDLKLAIECANAFSQSTGLGCSVQSPDGKTLHEVGYGCEACEVCATLHVDRTNCIQAHTYGMNEAERFGGKYIYFCPMGLSHFVSPIVGQIGSAAKVTVGPFRMVDLDEFITCDLQETRGIEPQEIDELMPVLEKIPYVSAGRVNALSTLLFMAVGFMNNVSATNRLLDSQDSEYVQGQISDFIWKLKKGEDLPQYPFETERELLASIAESDRPKAQKLLNELLGHILFSSGGDFARIKTRIYELLVMLSRSAVEGGASPEYAFQLTHEFFTKSQSIKNIENLCFNLTKIMNQFIDGVFSFSGVKNIDVIQKAVQYIRRNYARKVSLESVAEVVDLSPSYFSKIFKKEMGCNFNTYMNAIRIEKSMKLLLYEDLKLVNIATVVGFEDQSYFTKVFKRMTGVSPHHFRKVGGRVQSEHLDPHSIHPLIHQRKLP